MEDPFANAPAPDEAQAPAFNPPPAEEPAPAPAKKAPAKKAATVTVTNNTPDGKHVVTLKGGSGFDAPWYVIHASGLDELEELFGQDAGRLASLFERIQKAGSHFAGLGVFNGGPPKAHERAAAPAAAQQPPANTPAAPGPDWVYKSGITKSGPKAGQPWQGWMPPRGSDAKPIFF